MIDTVPRFLHGAYGFVGDGYDSPKLLDAALVYTVPSDKRAQLIYLRAGNSSICDSGQLQIAPPIGIRYQCSNSVE